MKKIKKINGRKDVFLMEETGVINSEKIEYTRLVKQIQDLEADIAEKKEVLVELKGIKSDIDKLK